MLTAETKRHIDAARQVLVGVVPNPAAQIDQITNALIYKFMDDMDQAAIRAGDKASFFVGELESYAWTRLMDSKLGNQERLNRYVEALEKFSTSQKLPELFRDIFREAYLPFRSPEVLWLFLKEIDYFGYSHSEELGNAYEYLLSILSAQGDAGQFRTPRHIIDFMVAVVNPTKDDTVLDPACGTAGFLISAYKHILAQHTGTNADGTPNEKSLLTPAQRRKVMENFVGYDISPEMVKLSKVNMYLHHFKNPKIYEYDTLSSEERWKDNFTVILANPPFMSPKGGVKPHNRFSVQSSRSEVLFVDYFIEHLKQPNGRAGMIVPEGIIFQSGSSHRQIRQNLVNDGLYAVVSLPAGVFNPYSGVKTSILFFDNAIAARTREVLFVRIQNDGYGLGAQRRETENNDLPDALNLLRAWREHVLNNAPAPESVLSLVVPKTKIAENNDYNLSTDRYRIETDYLNAKWPMVELGDVCEVLDSKRKPVKESDRKKGPFPYYGATGIVDYVDQFLFDEKLVLVGEDGAKWGAGEKTAFLADGKYWVNNHAHVLRPSRERLLDEFLISVLNNLDLSPYVTGVTVPKLNQEKLRSIKIPLPPISLQREVVAELGGYQHIIDGAREVVRNWIPPINFDPTWKKAKIGDIASLMTGGTPLSTKKEYYGGDIKWLVSGDIHKGEIFDCEGRITELALEESNAKLLPVNSVLIALNGQGKTRGSVALLRTEATCNQSLVAITPNTDRVTPEFLYYVLKSMYQRIREMTGDNERSGLNMPIIRSIDIPLPSLEIQKEIVTRIESERALVEANQKLIKLYEEKMRTTVVKVLEK